MDLFSFWFNTLTLLAQGALQLFFIARVTEKRLKPGHFAMYAAALYGVSFLCSLSGVNYVDIPLNILVSYAMGRFALKNDRPVSCVAAVLAVYIPQLSFGLMNSLSMIGFPAILGSRLLYLSAVLSSVLSLLLCFLCYQGIASRLSLDDGPGELLLWLLLPPGLFLFAVELYILSINYGSVNVIPGQLETGKHFMLLGLQFLGAVVLLSCLYAYRHTCEGLKAGAALASMEQESHAQKNYVEQARTRYENTRAFRHDVKNYLSVLDGFLKNGDMERARDYLKKLDAAAGELSFPVHTGNPTVDIMLGDKLALAKMDGIHLDLSFSLPQSCGFSDLDWCVMFGNALDNAVRACRQTEGLREIRIFGERQGDFYMLEFENTCSRDQPPVSRFGIGLCNIKNVVETYGGAMTVEHHHGLFRLNILLNLSSAPKAPCQGAAAGHFNTAR